MLKYLNKNVNPKNRKTGDCSTRALVTVTGLSYEECLKMQMEESLTCYYDPTSKQVMERVLKKLGWVKMAQPRKIDNTKYTVGEMDKILTNKELKAGVLVTVANHHTAIKEDNVVDIWDCRGKSVGNYYVKVGK